MKQQRQKEADEIKHKGGGGNETQVKLIGVGTQEGSADGYH